MTRECKPRPPLLILTYPRTASNLLMRMLSFPDQEDTVSVESGGYFFMPVIWKMREWELLDRPSTDWTDADWYCLEEIYTSCAENLEDLLHKAQITGKIAMFKEHTPFMISPAVQSAFVHGTKPPLDPWRVKLGSISTVIDGKDSQHVLYNGTVLPSEFLRSCVPSFLIRHPALAFPSYYRVTQKLHGDKENMEAMESALMEVCTLRWTRHLYDWFLALNSEPDQTQKRDPIILDADDILTNPKVLLRFCELVGLDPSKVQFQWNPAAGDQLEKVNPVRLHTRSTLYASSGIVTGKTFQGLTIDGELCKWKIEFGERVATKLHRWIVDAMPDYDYLAQRRLKIDEETAA
ncbi:hypothetical protein N7516_000164 [Penicillium verrucosum]|uniref:uncharacterized protein n=1 Tax=Penicillium verrucosum TaxID=60171 RepID=UPI002545BC22|nr:uncharacterized protein N7516_000164 [Penicillium verrucosum]KAJ5939996.1 hypothetical protein N7516_000164 [Penicillium verrucosum]